MSAFDTVDRDEEWSVRVYCEVPMDLDQSVMVSVGGRHHNTVTYMSPDQAIRIATALLVAAQRATHQAQVDGVLKGTP